MSGLYCRSSCSSAWKRKLHKGETGANGIYRLKRLRTWVANKTIDYQIEILDPEYPRLQADKQLISETPGPDG
ncbi:hypothetical protein MAM1_0105c05392 [Mucor ambiguus]|uniref:Uncharacterized protein n=1 Tax=Mucor ambiguus TaxID=91626 RepID=A0A0C9M784_9FUNG|nr:hypothetical protein MAM1_0105c05392 [Mucor ambiguus]